MNTDINFSLAPILKGTDTDTKRVLYFGDPMCSWCWGFAPQFSRIVQHVQERAEVHLFMGGLRTDAVTAWDQNLRNYVRQHWQNVAQRTHQPFHFSRFDDDQFIYNTEPACRALITVRGINPLATLQMFETLQHAFYATGQNITKTNVLRDCAQSCNIDVDLFDEHFKTSHVTDVTQTEFSFAPQFGVSGFPTVILIDQGHTQVLTTGFQKFENLSTTLEQWLIA